MLWLYKLQAAQYPFQPNDLEIEIWEILGLINLLMQQIREERQMQISMGKLANV